MRGDTKWIIGTLGTLILAMGGLALQQNCGLKSDIARIEADIARIEADIRELRSLHLHAATARQSNLQAVPKEQTSDSPGSL
ncbi:MAG: hypothetical protein OXN89_00380 [Bryobacterales bacterium]|nr:hypothetical protein [Bryobacterales bacterium]